MTRIEIYDPLRKVMTTLPDAVSEMNRLLDVCATQATENAALKAERDALWTELETYKVAFRMATEKKA